MPITDDQIELQRTEKYDFRANYKSNVKRR